MAPAIDLGAGRFAIARGTAARPQPSGGPVRCPMCGGDRFDGRAGALQSGRGCTELVCRACLFVLTFADPA